MFFFGGEVGISFQTNIYHTIDLYRQVNFVSFSDGGGRLEVQGADQAFSREERAGLQHKSNTLLFFKGLSLSSGIF